MTTSNRNRIVAANRLLRSRAEALHRNLAVAGHGLLARGLVEFVVRYGETVLEGQPLKLAGGELLVHLDGDTLVATNAAGDTLCTCLLYTSPSPRD
jgi:hypothetical protein